MVKTNNKASDPNNLKLFTETISNPKTGIKLSANPIR